MAQMFATEEIEKAVMSPTNHFSPGINKFKAYSKMAQNVCHRRDRESSDVTEKQFKSRH